VNRQVLSFFLKTGVLLIVCWKAVFSCGTKLLTYFMAFHIHLFSTNKQQDKFKLNVQAFPLSNNMRLKHNQSMQKNPKHYCICIVLGFLSDANCNATRHKWFLLKNLTAFLSLL